MSIDKPSPDPELGDAMGENLGASPRATATIGTSGAHTGGAKIIGGHANSSAEPGPQLMAADTLAGDPVVNRRGENLGEIRDIMIDVPSGSVGYAVLSFGGVPGTGDKLFAIPWNALILDMENQQFILDVPKRRLETAPGFDKVHWPLVADQQVMHRPKNTPSINRAMVLPDQVKLLTI